MAEDEVSAQDRLSTTDEVCAEDEVFDDVSADGVSADEEHARRRHARFGRLPGHVPPEEWVESVEAEPQHEEPPEPVPRREWG